MVYLPVGAAEHRSASAAKRSYRRGKNKKPFALEKRSYRRDKNKKPFALEKRSYRAFL